MVRPMTRQDRRWDYLAAARTPENQHRVQTGIRKKDQDLPIVSTGATRAAGASVVASVDEGLSVRYIRRMVKNATYDRVVGHLY